MLTRMVLVFVIAACSSGPGDEHDPCEVSAVTSEGVLEVGLGDPFVPIADGQEVTVQLGAQGLWMFVVSARVQDMEVGLDDRRAAIELDAIADNTTVSLEVGCRGREFADVGGHLQMVTPFFLALDPAFTPQLDGASVTIVGYIRDHAGRAAMDERRVIARLPP